MTLANFKAHGYILFASLRVTTLLEPVGNQGFQVRVPLPAMCRGELCTNCPANICLSVCEAGKSGREDLINSHPLTSMSCES